ncbi:hypothetical protein AMECASPLE_031760 [Ameca splendens]|uniref:Uncharacterized protein n=1 Tax=Ameca splendens TaxID=208324 RepID=A0ABV0ZFV1_9TELE
MGPTGHSLVFRPWTAQNRGTEWGRLMSVATAGERTLPPRVSLPLPSSASERRLTDFADCEGHPTNDSTRVPPSFYSGGLGRRHRLPQETLAFQVLAGAIPGAAGDPHGC